MKKILKKYSLAATLMAILCLLPASCITDDAPAATEKATVTMTFTTRAVTDDTNGSSLLDNEQMRTLHVIMVRSSDSEVILNERYDIAPEVTSQTITYNDLVVDKNNGTEFDFYAIVNEGSLTLTEEVTEILNSKTTIDNVSLLENVILGENGFDYAYRFPGMNKVLQAAGRVIRTKEDVGCILLMDERFRSTEYRILFPEEWNDMHICRMGNVESILKDFWKRNVLDIQ